MGSVKQHVMKHLDQKLSCHTFLIDSNESRVELKTLYMEFNVQILVAYI